MREISISLLRINSGAYAFSIPIIPCKDNNIHNNHPGMVSKPPPHGGNGKLVINVIQNINAIMESVPK